MNTLYLASGSPRRLAILTDLGYRVEKLAASIDETPYPNEIAAEYAARMAREKNQAAINQWQQQHPTPPEYPLLTADTTVALNSHILGKPENPAHAAEMLRALSGSVHQVISAVCVNFSGSLHQICQTSHVHFKTLSEAEIQAYIAGGEPMDKAGAYGIQGIGGAFVRHLEGSFTGVMGLPVYETLELLRRCGYPVPPFTPIQAA